MLWLCSPICSSYKNLSKVLSSESLENSDIILIVTKLTTLLSSSDRGASSGTLKVQDQDQKEEENVVDS